MMSPFLSLKCVSAAIYFLSLPVSGVVLFLFLLLFTVSLALCFYCDSGYHVLSQCVGFPFLPENGCTGDHDHCDGDVLFCLYLLASFHFGPGALDYHLWQPETHLQNLFLGSQQ
eukprot:TRINITY_DN16005_c0_g1_i1.p2 TRINITY_DN16005_c0_g1~~TRINITY_DN16005_c0_g1_i1.p2  ORF type:complete len:114 (+),score=22.51 TRINITY_DN16005_c0_g1_i1:248-589(+)